MKLSRNYLIAALALVILYLLLSPRSAFYNNLVAPPAKVPRALKQLQADYQKQFKKT